MTITEPKITIEHNPARAEGLGVVTISGKLGETEGGGPVSIVMRTDELTDIERLPAYDGVFKIILPRHSLAYRDEARRDQDFQTLYLEIRDGSWPALETATAAA